MADLRAALGHALDPAYRVEREVRPVGNCRMFVALDQAAGTELLVKVLPTPLSLGVDHVKFEAELAALGSRLAHRGLVAPQGGGRAGSFIYHTRPFIQGTTLRAALARQGELPLRRAVEVLHDILDALGHAHATGIWHGDLKPENVLLADGQTLVSDAGVFSAVERSWGGGAVGTGDATMTALCATEYLAPERRAGGGEGARGGSSRDDVFAVGVMLHEMLTGRPPGERAEPLESVRSVPPWLGELGRRCRAAEPSERWSDAAAAFASGSWPGAGGGGPAE
ncbi:MAG TPA: protein kinase [Gemmatimonadales bacterium]|nr:protein kinase [Gemmatimonadales bacterium]